MAKVCKTDGEGTIAGTRGNGEDAPKAVIGGATSTVGFDPGGVKTQAFNLRVESLS
jgi:hypothetical protein